MDRKEFAREQKWLDRVYKEIDEQLAEQEAQVREFYAEMREIRRSLSEEHRISSAGDKRLMDAAQRIVELRHGAVEFGIQHRLLRQLRALERNPYFGRIDFREEGAPSSEAIYVGVRSLLDRATGWPLVYDWRAPISSMFYDYGLGEAQYTGPGGTYRGEITLKRQYGIKHRQLQYMFDNELTIDDEILREALGRNATAKMRTIVNTIQREQNQAIRNDQDARLLVEGAAGSGKTSVALHRVAYMLYKYRESLEPENILVFSPNKIFSDYISQVLPDLGEENVPQLTYREFAESFFDWQWDVETHVAYLEELLSQDEDERQRRLERCSFKSSPAFQRVLDALIQLVTGEAAAFSDIYMGKKLLMSAAEQERLFGESYAYLPVQKRLLKIRQRILHVLRPLKKRRLRAVLNAIQQEAAFEGETWLAKAREAVRRVRRELEPLLTRLNSQYKVDSITWYRRLWQDPGLWERVAGELKAPSGAGESLRTLDEGCIAFEDVVPLMYLKGELEGYPLRRGILHVVVDEVQDYAPLQLRVLTSTFPAARYTLVGDVYQSLHPYVWGSSADQLEELFAGLDLRTVRLNKSYRSTQEIFRFCSALLGGSGAETVLRTGRKPQVYQTAPGKQVELIAGRIKAHLENGYEMIAVITKTAQECHRIYGALRELDLEVEPTLLVKESGEFQKGVLVLPVFLAKGLEFDAVIIADASSQCYGAGHDKRLLYVACSRALHDLDLVCPGELSPFLRSLPADLKCNSKCNG
ncbi:RNA polymerase recycling motor HelD [Candidatus Darwinibacter acetoxidans]